VPIQAAGRRGRGDRSIRTLIASRSSVWVNRGKGSPVPKLVVALAVLCALENSGARRLCGVPDAKHFGPLTGYSAQLAALVENDLHQITDLFDKP
jgi:hypothetical protein